MYCYNINRANSDKTCDEKQEKLFRFFLQLTPVEQRELMVWLKDIGETVNIGVSFKETCTQTQFLYDHSYTEEDRTKFWTDYSPSSACLASYNKMTQEDKDAFWLRYDVEKAKDDLDRLLKADNRPALYSLIRAIFKAA